MEYGFNQDSVYQPDWELVGKMALFNEPPLIRAIVKVVSLWGPSKDGQIHFTLKTLEEAPGRKKMLPSEIGECFTVSRCAFTLDAILWSLRPYPEPEEKPAGQKGTGEVQK